MSQDHPPSPDAFAALQARFQQQSRKAQAYYTVMHEAGKALGSDAAAHAWMNAPLAALGGQTPAQLVGAGREDEALAQVRAQVVNDALVRLLGADEAAAQAGQLADVLMDCVDGGASVSFMLPLARDKAIAFWRGVADGVARGERTLVVAEDAQGIVGTVQLITAMPDNQPHRADVAKLLVHRRARGSGIGRRLMEAVEDAARAKGRHLLVLDTASATAERLYERLGWQRVGVVPAYALLPQGGLCATTFYYKHLA